MLKEKQRTAERQTDWLVEERGTIELEGRERTEIVSVRESRMYSFMKNREQLCQRQIG